MGHRDVKFLGLPLGRGEPHQPIEHLPARFFRPMAGQVDDRQTNVLGVGERRQGPRLESLHQLIVGQHHIKSVL